MWKKEIKDSFRVTYPQVPPYSNVGNYYQSQNAVGQVSSLNDEDLPGTFPGIDFVAAHRDFLQVEEKLEEKRKFREQERAKLRRIWNDVEQLELSFRENFTTLSDFLKTNEDKKKRAILRYELDVKLTETRQKDIEKLIQENNWLKQSKSEVDKEIDEHKLYEDFLDSVIGIAGDFINVGSIVDRYESLVKTKIELGKRQQDSLGILEEAKNTLSKMTDENNFRLLGMSNVLTNLHERYQTVLSRSLRWEKLVHIIKNNALRKFTEINEVKQSCRNIYWLMCKRKGEEPKIAEDDCEAQLVYIKKTLRQLENVKTEAFKNINKVISSTKVETSKDS